jgi:hypothetical protein
MGTKVVYWNSKITHLFLIKNYVHMIYIEDSSTQVIPASSEEMDRMTGEVWFVLRVLLILRYYCAFVVLPKLPYVLCA